MGLQVNPQVTPSQVAVAFAGGAQGTQRAPHERRLVLLEHASPHAWNPTSQTRPHVPPLHVATPLAGVAQGEQAPPQLAGLASLTHAAPQR